MTAAERPDRAAGRGDTDQTVTLTWNAATDDVAVTGYEIHRSDTDGFTPDGDAPAVTTVPAAL